jgi:hypothetical protein
MVLLVLAVRGVQGAQRISGLTVVSGWAAGVGATAPGKPLKKPPASLPPPPQAESAQATISAAASRVDKVRSRMGESSLLLWL